MDPKTLFALDEARDHLIFAIRNFDLGHIHYLLRIDRNLNLNHSNMYGWTPICYAIAYNQSYFRNLPVGHRDHESPEVPHKSPIEMIDMLINAGAEVPSPNLKDQTGKALWKFVSLEVLRFLWKEKGVWGRREVVERHGV